MVEFKLAIGDSKTKRTFKAALKSPEADQLIGKKIGDKFRGELIGLTGFEFEITGGSDKAGFPMRADIEGIGRRKVLHDGKLLGFNSPKKFKGQRRRKTVCANTIADDTVQINCKIIKWGTTDLMKHFGLVKAQSESKDSAVPSSEGATEEPKPEEKKEAQPETKEVSAEPSSKAQPEQSSAGSRRSETSAKTAPESKPEEPKQEEKPAPSEPEKEKA